MGAFRRRIMERGEMGGPAGEGGGGGLEGEGVENHEYLVYVGYCIGTVKGV